MTPTPTTGTSGSHNAHARLSPSSADRWARCTASTKFIEDNQDRIPPDRGSVYAQEGSDAHDLCEAVLTGKTTISEVPQDFRPHVKFYVDHCQGLMQEGDYHFVEAKVPLFYSPEENGTCDFAIIRDGRVIIRDLKYGQGVLVEAENNAQLAIYALSFIYANNDVFDLGPDTIVDIGIVQPRHHADDPVRTWEIALADLEHGFVPKLKEAVENTRNGTNLEFKANDKSCKWCPAKAICQYRVTNAADPVGFDVLADLPDLTKEEKKLPVADRIERSLRPFVEDPDAGIVSSKMSRDWRESKGIPENINSDENLVKLWSNRKAITSLLDDIEEYLQVRAESGNPAPGTKLVSGREGNRKWGDEEAAEKFLATTCKLKMDERFKFTLIPPTQAEKLIADKLQTPRSKAKFLSLVSRSDGRPVVALDDDKRPAISASVDGLDDETICDDL
jgi:hypothetical protein